MIKAGRWSEASRSDLFSQLRRNVICEICLGLLVVAIVGWLGITPPARHSEAPNVAPRPTIVYEVGSPTA